MGDRGALPPREFQFLLVQLRRITNRKFRANGSVSIPLGAIKANEEISVIKFDVNVSIPLGAIKARPYHCACTISEVSIPLGAIKAHSPATREVNIIRFNSSWCN